MLRAYAGQGAVQFVEQSPFLFHFLKTIILSSKQIIVVNQDALILRTATDSICLKYQANRVKNEDTRTCMCIMTSR